MDKQTKETEFKFIIIGGNAAELNESIMNNVSAQCEKITIFELTTQEIGFIIDYRAKNKAEETAVDFINDDENKKRVDEWINILINKHLLIHFKENNDKRKMKKYNDIFSGKEIYWMIEKELKEVSKLSWKDFEELIESMNLFGVVNKKNNNGKKFISFNVNPENVRKNKISEVKEIMKLLVGKIDGVNENKNEELSELSIKVRAVLNDFKHVIN